jgi:hypothetical protein
MIWIWWRTWRFVLLRAWFNFLSCSGQIQFRVPSRVTCQLYSVMFDVSQSPFVVNLMHRLGRSCWRRAWNRMDDEMKFRLRVTKVLWECSSVCSDLLKQSEVQSSRFYRCWFKMVICFCFGCVKTRESRLATVGLYSTGREWMNFVWTTSITIDV